MQAADRAFWRGDWPQLSSRDRTQRLLKLAALIREQAEELARLESRNVGKPIRQARDDVALAANCFEYYAGAVNKVGGQTIPVAARGLSMTLREPIGVCGLITPWNFPIAIATWKIAPALAMGNTIVLKPASQTPLTALRLGQLAFQRACLTSFLVRAAKSACPSDWLKPVWAETRVFRQAAYEWCLKTRFLATLQRLLSDLLSYPSVPGNII